MKWNEEKGKKILIERSGKNILLVTKVVLVNLKLRLSAYKLHKRYISDLTKSLLKRRNKFFHALHDNPR